MVEPIVACPIAPVTPIAVASTIHARLRGKSSTAIRIRKNAATAVDNAIQNATCRGQGSTCTRKWNGRSPIGL
jgi:hypothetical protein